MLNKEIIEQFNSYTDEELIRQTNDIDADVFSILMYRYEDFLKLKASNFDSDKTHFDDYLQEAILSFFTVVNTFDDTKSSFRTYLNVCVTRTLISFKRKLSRQNAFIDDEIEKLQSDAICDPQSMIENEERVTALIADIKRTLSKFELKALTLYLSGNSYENIAKDLGKTPKSVDNALQRVRIKLKNRS